VKRGIFMFLVFLFSSAHAWASDKHIYIFEMELTTDTGVEGPVLVRLGEGHPAYLTSPTGHVVEITMKQVVRDDRALTEILSNVKFSSVQGEEVLELPRMMISGTGEASLAPRRGQGNDRLVELRITLASVEKATDAEFAELASKSTQCDVPKLSGTTALDWGMGSGTVTYAGCCSLTCSGGNDSGDWTCCGAVVTCCCNASGGCCSPDEAASIPS